VASRTPSIQFIRQTNGRRLAYTVHGSGPPVVCPAWWVSHLEDDWKHPGFRELFGGLALHHTVVRYDRPGSGLSDRERDSIDLEGEVATLSELVDHLELGRFSLFAVSCAGPPALAYAAAHPERVSRLAFFGSFLRGRDVGPPEIKEAIKSLVLAHWGIGSRTITNLLAPDLPEPDVKLLSRGQRAAASPEMAAELLALTFDVDVTPLALDLQTPVLVMHRKGDRTIRHEAGRELAASLPNAELVTLNGNAHVPWIGDVPGVRDTVLRFLGTDVVTGAPDAPDSSAAGIFPGELRRSGDVWTISFAGRSVYVKHARGLMDLAVLLTHPEQEVHVAELWSGAHSAVVLSSGADPVLDDQALRAYRDRLQQLDQAIATAEERGAVDNADRHRQERDALGKELRAAVGLGGRRRRLGELSERARKAISARIRASIQKILAVHPELGVHLETSISTGTFCAYNPNPPVSWSFSESS
jgi:pimeloyl-ACP methyl ester carboxylesterase